jgi:DNA polymerase III subunit gamma/tau
MEYRVLARKYRPANFDALIGQDVLVRTLSNAIASGRIAHAFLLTGIRGVGKTTTARIIARALNCIGENGTGSATINPCGVCTHCTMIAQDRHVDVLEMDAASHTGVGDIRELIESVRYLPSSGRYKIYIIDEVHMLSTSAFNALLKTLEEPPPHVKFIFATTEARKIPVTILSRCQRFDLKRIDAEMLTAHLMTIAGKEQVIMAEDAARLIAIAAEGSVRDSLSLLDQAIARGSDITATSVRQMLGTADNTATFSLLQLLLKGDVAGALSQLQKQYHDGADSLLIVQDCLEVTHLITRVKVAQQALADVTLSENDRTQAKAIADAMSMPVLTRLWQMLLKGISEVRLAPSPLAALEMLAVRIAYAAQLPTPAEIIRGGEAAPAKSSAPKEKQAAPKPNLELVNTAVTSTVHSFSDAVALFEKHREALIFTQLRENVRLVEFAPGQITLKLTANLPREFTTRVADALSRWTGQSWKIMLSDAQGEPSLYEQENQRKGRQLQEAAAHPLVSSVLEAFPGAKVTQVKS